MNEIVKVNKNINLKQKLNIIDQEMITDIKDKYYDSALKVQIWMWLKGKAIAEEILGRTMGKVLPSFYQLEKETGRGHADLKKWYILYEANSDKEKYLKIAKKIAKEQTLKRLEGIKALTGEKKLLTEDNWKRYYDVWNFANKLEGFGEDRPAQCPPQVILNFIYYFTKENDLIIDPMAGGGAMTDCANYLNRKSLCYDIVPYPDKQVKFNDIGKGYPEEIKRCDAIFIDPPYGSQKGEVFEKNSVSNLSTSDFVEKFLRELFINSYRILKNKGKIGFIITNQCHINLERKYYWDFGFEAFRLMKESGFIPYRRISVPLIGPIQYKEYDMTRAKENKELLGILRDLIVMEK